MNRFFTLLLAASCLTAVGQVEVPWNPDGNADGLIGVEDLQDFLSVYGSTYLITESSPCYPSNANNVCLISGDGLFLLDSLNCRTVLYARNNGANELTMRLPIEGCEGEEVVFVTERHNYTGQPTTIQAFAGDSWITLASTSASTGGFGQSTNHISGGTDDLDYWMVQYHDGQWMCMPETGVYLFPQN